MAVATHDLKTRMEAMLSAEPEPVVVRVTLAEYLATTYRPDREWIGGELRERNMGEGSHAVIQKFLAMYLGQREEEWGILVRTEQRVQVAEDRYRVPDVCVTRAEEPFEQIVHVPPLLCIEILSREDTASGTLERMEDYRVMGVPMIWMIDPRRRAASMMDSSGDLIRIPEELFVPKTEVRLRLPELFAQLNRLEKRS